MGTNKGLASFDIKTGKFTHIQKKINDKPLTSAPLFLQCTKTKKVLSGTLPAIF